jgi:hypothetical protein
LATPTHRGEPGRDREVDACDDVSDVDALVHQGDDLGLREDTALVGDGAGLLALILQSRDSLEPAAERAGHALEESARSRGAAVVHLEIEDRSLLGDGDHLAVLPPDVHHGADRRHHPVGALGVAGDLREVLLGEGNLQAAVSRRDDVVEVVDRGEAGLLERLLHDQVGRPPGVRRGGQDGRADHGAVLQHDGLARRGADVESPHDHT